MVGGFARINYFVYDDGREYRMLAYLDINDTASEFDFGARWSTQKRTRCWAGKIPRCRSDSSLPKCSALPDTARERDGSGGRRCSRGIDRCDVLWTGWVSGWTG